MNQAILFWFYKEPEICENRLKLLKKYNPTLKIFGLFGGEQAEAEKYQDKLRAYLGDFYVSPFRDSEWKWMNGDLMILDWYERRGKNLDWDGVAVVQWDTLVFDSIFNQFPGIKKDEIFLSGLRILDKEVEESWDWTRPGGDERENYLRFKNYAKERYGHAGDIFCCLFILQIFPRLFLEKYSAVQDKEIGMLEYRVPTYAKIFGAPFYEKDLGARWFEKEERPLNAIPEEIGENYIERELAKKDGWRIFHPYYKVWEKNI